MNPSFGGILNGLRAMGAGELNAGDPPRIRRCAVGARFLLMVRPFQITETSRTMGLFRPVLPLWNSRSRPRHQSSVNGRTRKGSRRRVRNVWTCIVSIVPASPLPPDRLSRFLVYALASVCWVSCKCVYSSRLRLISPAQRSSSFHPYF